MKVLRKVNGNGETKRYKNDKKTTKRTKSGSSAGSDALIPGPSFFYPCEPVFFFDKSKCNAKISCQARLR